MKPVLFLLSFLSCLSAFCQNNAPDEDVHARLLPGKTRSLIAYSGKDHSFTMEASARTTKLSDIPGFVNISGQIVQSTLIPASSSADTRNLTTAREKELLLKYMNYELSYYKKKLKQNYTHLETEWVTIQDRLFLVWYFDMPPNYKLVSRQLYFSTLFFDQVMDLNAPLFKTNNFEKARGILSRLAGSMKTYNKQLDLDKLGKQLNKS